MDDPALRSASLEKLLVYSPDSPAFNILWPHLFAGVDPREVLESRRRMKLELARYARLGAADEHLGWGDVPVRELRRLHRTLGEILEGEGAARTATEG